MQLKPIFIQKVVPALVFYRQLSEIFNNNFFKEKKKHCHKKKSIEYKKRGSDINGSREVPSHKSHFQID